MLEDWDYQDSLRFLDQYAAWRYKQAEQNSSKPNLNFFNYENLMKDLLLGSLIGGTLGVATNFILEPERKQRDLWNNFGLGALLGASAGGLWNYFK
ncbi:MAG: hypothetical protein QXS68_06525 [Candidatus Methanomethylicaceae archaeon]